MPRIVWIKPGTKLQYVTTNPADPNVPAGYYLSNTSDGSGQFADGVTDLQAQTYVGGLASGGFPIYSGYGNGEGLGKNPNGILGG